MLEIPWFKHHYLHLWFKIIVSVYSEVSLTEFNGTYSQRNEHRIASLLSTLFHFSIFQPQFLTSRMGIIVLTYKIVVKWSVLRDISLGDW